MLALIWLASLTLGLRSLFSYETTPGVAGHPPDFWPEKSAIHSVTPYTLVMAAHPNCPCTRATMDELAQIMAHTGGKLSTYVLFLKPEKSGSDWNDTTLVKTAAAIPGVTAISDVDGREGQRFGVETSGHVLLFNAGGRRLFSGGITAARGHSGDNAGESAIETIVNGGSAKQNATLVFGCPLHNSSDRHN
jgi:hypothetical protein